MYREFGLSNNEINVRMYVSSIRVSSNVGYLFVRIVQDCSAYGSNAPNRSVQYDFRTYAKITLQISCLIFFYIIYFCYIIYFFYIIHFRLSNRMEYICSCSRSTVRSVFLRIQCYSEWFSFYLFANKNNKTWGLVFE